MKKPNIGLIDTGTSNIKSVYYALKEVGGNVKLILNNDQTKENLDAIVVPGIGSFKFVIDKLKKERLDKFILESIEKKKPSLFICVGLQILFSESEEFGKNKGLNIFKGKVIRIKQEKNGSKKRQIPFIGWNKILKKKECKILKNIKNENFFYFTHSFHANPEDTKIISSEVNYDNYKYCASVSDRNIFATQFHPEKSAKQGIQLYKNFIKLI